MSKRNSGCLFSFLSIFQRHEPIPRREYEEPELTQAQIDKLNKLKGLDQEVTEDSINYANSYQRRYLLSKNEWYAYKKLRNIAEVKNLQICPKVRMLDLVEPKNGKDHYKTLLWKIQAKHVDFLICDKDMRIKAILELDDNSHNASDRKERDTFVDEVLTSVGYKVIRTKYINDDILDCLSEHMEQE